MAIIKTYPLKSSYFSQDRLVLSDMQPDSEGIVKGETKSLTLASLKNFIGSQVLDVSASTDTRYAGTFVSPSIGNVKVGIDISSLPNLTASSVNGTDKLIINSSQDNKKIRINELFETVGLATNSSINYTVKLPSTVGGASQVLQLPSVIGSSPHQLEWSTPAGSGTVIGTGTTNYIPKWNSSSELTDSVVFESSGNIGIGTTAPAFKLEVIDTIGVSGLRPIRMNSATGAIDIRGSGAGGWANAYNFNGSLNTVLGGFGCLGLGDTMNYFYIGSAYNNTTMVIKPNNGNVGIGTTAPISKLDVRGVLSFPYISTTTGTTVVKFSESNDDEFLLKANLNGTGSTGNSMSFGSGISGWASDIMTWRGDGSVGIGTTAPNAKLDILDTINQTAIRVTNNQYNNYLIQKRRTDDTQILGIKEFGSIGGLALVTGSSERLNISNLGNVGIGTTTPDAKLEVIGNYKQKVSDGNIGGFTISINSGTDAVDLNNYYNAPLTFSINNTEKMRINSGGNVGIGTTAPNAKLHVQDTSGSTSQIRISAASANANFAFLEMEDVTANTSKLTLGTTVGYNVQKPALSIFNSYTTLLGNGTSNGRLLFNCSANTHSVEIQGPDHAGGTSYSLKLPNSLPSVSNQILESNALGVLSWIPTPSGGGGGGGTVTSVGLSAPPAFSVSNSPITGSGSISLGVTGGTVGEFLAYNGQWATPPDTGTIVVGNPGAGASAVLAGISIGSTVYSIPQGTGNGTITSVQAGTGISGGGSSGIVTVTNSDRGSSQLFYRTFAPDNGTSLVASTNQDSLTVKGGSGITTSGSGDQLSISNNLAASLERGGIQIGYTQNGKNYPVLLSGEKAYVNVPWTSGGGGIGFSGTTVGGLATYSNSTTAGVSSKVNLNASGLMDFDYDGASAAAIDFDPLGTRLKIGDLNGEGAIVELWADGSRAFQVGVNGEIGLGTGASQGTSGQVLTSQGNGSPATWSSGGTQNFANADLTQTASRTYAMAQYPLTFTGTSTISLQNSNGLVVSGNIISNSQSYAAKNSISNKNTSFTVDCNDGNVQQVNLTNGSGNVIISFSNVRAGARYTVITTRLGYEGTYGTYSFNSVLWPNNSTPQNVPAGSGTFNMYEFVATTTSSSGMLGYFFRNYQTAS